MDIIVYHFIIVTDKDEVLFYYENPEINTNKDTFDTLIKTIYFAYMNLYMFIAFL